MSSQKVNVLSTAALTGKGQSMLKQEIREHLEKKILPFWEKLADPEWGGYYGYVDKELRLMPEADKGCILNSRILWTFSTAARELERPDLTPYAERAYAFMQRFEDPENGGVFWSVTREGRPSDTTKHTYCQAFAIYGLAAYYRLTGKREALDKAMALFRLIESKCSDEGGYLEALKADFSPESNEKLSENGVMASRTMNTILHVVEAYAELQRAQADEAVRAAGQKCLERLLNTFYNPEKRRLEVFCDAEYRSLLDMQSYGHDIEASWLLWDAAETLLPEAEREPYRRMCLALAESVRERAFTDHGLKNECVNGVNDELRIWWVQAETMLGLENAWELTGDSAWLDRMKTQWQSIRRLIVDKREDGEWYWSVHEDGTLTERPMVEEWKCPYHNGRMCLRLLQAGIPESV